MATQLSNLTTRPSDRAVVNRASFGYLGHSASIPRAGYKGRRRAPDPPQGMRPAIPAVPSCARQSFVSERRTAPRGMASRAALTNNRHQILGPSRPRLRPRSWRRALRASLKRSRLSAFSNSGLRLRSAMSRFNSRMFSARRCWR